MHGIEVSDIYGYEIDFLISNCVMESCIAQRKERNRSSSPKEGKNAVLSEPIAGSADCWSASPAGSPLFAPAPGQLSGFSPRFAPRIVAF